MYSLHKGRNSSPSEADKKLWFAWGKYKILPNEGDAIKDTSKTYKSIYFSAAIITLQTHITGT